MAGSISKKNPLYAEGLFKLFLVQVKQFIAFIFAMGLKYMYICIPAKM